MIEELEDIENLPFHTNQTPEQLKELEEMKTFINENISKDPKLRLEDINLYNNSSIKNLCLDHLSESNYLYGYCNYLLGNNNVALDYCLKALKTSNSIELNNKTYICLGAIYTYFGEFNKAIESYNVAINSNISFINPSIFNNVAAIYFKQKDFKSAIYYLNKALENADNNLNLTLTFLNNIGRSYIELNELENAEIILHKVEDYLNVIENRSQEMNVLLNIGLLYFKQEKFSEAYTKLLDSYIKCKELKLKNNLYSATLFLAQACSKNKMPDQANNYYLETLELVKDIDKRLFNSALKYYIDFLLEQKEFEKASQYFLNFDAIKDQIIQEDKEKEISALTVKFQNTEQKLEIEKLNREKEFQQTLLAQAEDIKKSNEQLLLINQELTNANHELMENKILRAQMNPHFVYNTLNSISSLIKTNRNAEADIYLQEFSLLTRQIFENNAKNDCSLQDEINFCLRYISLEKLRFEDKFQFYLEIDPNIKSENCWVPSMILQPLLENSIKHGVFHLDNEETGILQLKIQLASNQLYFEISDNGIGLNDSIEEIFNKERESSLLIVNKRINIFNKTPTKNICLNYSMQSTKGCVCSFLLNYKLFN